METIMPTQLENLKQLSTIVADTSNIEAIKKYQPVDATTNPSLILKACSVSQYSHLLKEGLSMAKKKKAENKLSFAANWLSVQIGKTIVDSIPGRVSTEIDARLSFNSQATIKRAFELIELYNHEGVEPDRLLIKIASTWEGIQAAAALEKEGIHCNLTLLFSLEQAKACADSGVYLISPFVGRITDWYKKQQNIDNFSAESDPGVQSVIKIYNYYKALNYQTIVMAASFRNTEQIIALAGCDKLTINPVLLDQLNNCSDEVQQQLSADNATSQESATPLDEASFRWLMNENPMATEKLAEGIRLFSHDLTQLKNQLKSLI